MGKKTNVPTYKCQECGLTYTNQELAEKCSLWCSTHKSCNLEIIAYAKEHNRDLGKDFGKK